MKFDTKTMLTDRLTQLQCDRIPAWVLPRLTVLVEAEASTVTAKAEAELRERVARAITVKSIGAALVAGPEIEAKKA